MTSRTMPQNGNVTPFRARAKGATAQPRSERLEAARYIAQMALELERIANTAELELVSYFLAMARAEADAVAGPAPPSSGKEKAGDVQAPYRAD